MYTRTGIGQKRQHWGVYSSTSDRAVTDEDYLAARGKYLRFERDIMRKLSIILRRPDNYCDDHEEVWDGTTPDEIWDASRMFNVDEVPFFIDMKSGQVATKEESKRIRQRAFNDRLNKYRQGTLVVVSGVRDILLIVIIFPGGGETVSKTLKKMEGMVQGNVMWAATKSGNMNGRIWELTLRLIQNRTKKLRGCMSGDGKDWERAIALYFDNFASHLDERITREYSEEYGIFARTLLKNTSHIQQPVDQHIGRILKLLVRDIVLRLVTDIETYVSFGRSAAHPKQKWREYTCRLVMEAERQVKRICAESEWNLPKI